MTFAESAVENAAFALPEFRGHVLTNGSAIFFDKPVKGD
jgi:hypothetical protein